MLGLTTMKLNKSLWIVFIATLLTVGFATQAFANPALRVTQNVPDTFIGDRAGKTYQATITNNGNVTANHLRVNIDIPAGFYLIGTPTAVFKTGSDDPGTPLSAGAGGTDPFEIALTKPDTETGTEIPVSLDPGQSVMITYQLATTLEVAPGNGSVNTLTVNETYDYLDETDGHAVTDYTERYNTLINVLQGKISVSLTPLDNSTRLPLDAGSFKAQRGDIVTLEAKLTNSGAGPLYNIQFEAAWGANFGLPRLLTGESNITPTLNGQSYTYATINNDPAQSGDNEPLQPGDSLYFRYQLTVSDYHAGFELTGTATTSPASPGNPSAASALFTFIVNQPNIDISPYDNDPGDGKANTIAVDYGSSPQTVAIIITNGGTGPARQFKLHTDINRVFSVANIGSGWTYDAASGTFSYVGDGVIGPGGDVVPLTFDVTPAHPEALRSNPSAGTIIITPSYLNDIDQTFSYPIAYQYYSINNVPTLNLNQNVRSDATDSDNARIYLGEQLHFDYTPVLTHIDKFRNDREIVLTDTVPGYFSIQSVTVQSGTYEWNGNTLTWHLTPAEAGSSPVLTLDLKATADPGLADSYLTNTATLGGTTLWCTLSVSRTASLYLQSRDDVPANYTYESKSLVSPPAEGYDVCGKDGKNIVGYQVDYIFDSNAAGYWTGSTLNDKLTRGQIYLSDSSHKPQYRIASGDWQDIPAGSVTGTTPQLTLDLGFLQAVLGSNEVRGQTVSLRYWLRLTDASLPLGEGKPSSDRFTAVTELVLAGATGGSGPDGNVFYQGVTVPISRAALNLITGLNTTEVSKGQIVHATIDVGNVGNTSWDKRDLTVTLITPTASGSPNGSYSYLGPLTLDPTHVTGFNGQIPEVIISGTPEQVQFKFLNPVTAGGTISFDLVKTDSDNYTFQTQLSFTDGLGNISTASAAYAPTICEEGSLSLIVSPDPIQVTASTVTWQIKATNIGNGIAYGAVLEDNFHGILDFDSSAVDGVKPASDLSPSWNLGDLNPGAVKIITVTARTNGNSNYTTATNQIIAALTWVDRSSASHDFNTRTLTAKPKLVNMNSASSTFIENRCDPGTHVELCSDATLKLYVKNNGLTTNYKYVITQSFGQTGFQYIPGSVTVNGSPLPAIDPGISGTNGNTLTFSYTDFAQLASLAPQQDLIISFRVNTDEHFNSFNKIQPSAQWQYPTDNTTPGGSMTGAEFLVPQFLPNVTVEVKGAKYLPGDDYTAYAEGKYSEDVIAEVGDQVVWRVKITNGGATAVNVTLNNVIPANMQFESINAYETELVPGSKWKIPDIADGSATPKTVIYYILAKTTSCSGTLKDQASVTWGPQTSSLSTPGHNTDTANLLTQPKLEKVTVVIGSFTTKAGLVTVSLKTSGAPLHDLVLPLDITNRFQVDGSMTYGGGLPAPVTAPASGDSGALIWSWSGGVTISAGTYTISFAIRDNGTANYCSDGSKVNTLNNHYTFANSQGDLFGGFYDLDATPAQTLLTVQVDPQAQVLPGDGSDISWTITVKNTGMADATNLEIREVLGDGTLANGFTYLPTTSPTPNNIDGNILTWSNLSLAVGETYTITVNARVNSGGLHTATVTATEYNVDRTAFVDQKAVTAATTLVNFSKAMDQSTGAGNDPTADSYGEIVKYTLTVNYLDASDYRNIVINDTLPAGLQYVNENVSSAKTTITPNHSGKNLTWNLTDFTGPEIVTIVYYARIVDEGQARGSILKNAAKIGFTLRYGNGTTVSFPDTLAGQQSQQSFVLKRPDLSFTRSAAPASGSTVIAGETITHHLTVTNQNLDDVAPAHEMKIVETLPSGERGTDPSGTVIINKNGSLTLTSNTDYTCSYDPTGGKLTITFSNDTALGILGRNESFAIQYQTTVDGGIGSGVALSHSAQLSYESQPATTAGTKSFTASATVGFTTQSSPYTLAINSPGSGKVKPGDTVSYRLSFTVPKGTAVYDISLVDKLPAGLAYNSGSNVLQRNGTNYQTLVAAVSNIPATGQTLTWAAAENVDLVNSDNTDWVFTMDFTATVLNDGTAVVNNKTLTDSYVFNYNRQNGSSGSRTSNPNKTANLTVSEPQLTIAGTVIPSGSYEAGQTVGYQLTIRNTSAETAYDVSITDMLPAGLSLAGTPTTDHEPVQFTANGQELTWGGDGNLDLGPGSQINIRVNATLNEAVKPRQVISNSPSCGWSSQDGTHTDERTYSASVTQPPAITVNDATSLTQDITGTPADVIGEKVHYQLGLTLTRGTTGNVSVYDTLPAGVEFVSAVITPAGSGAGSVQFAVIHAPQAGDQGTIRWDFGTVTVPGDQNNLITIDYIVRILNITENKAGEARNNSAYLGYRDAMDVNRNTANQIQTFTIKEPAVVISKSYASGTHQAGDTVACTIKIWHNTAASPHDVSAYDLTVEDEIPTGMTYVAGSANSSVALNGNQLLWQIGQIDPSHDLNNPVVLTYDVLLADTVQPGQQITGGVNLTWSSLPGEDAMERTGNDGVGGSLNNYAVATSATLNAVNSVGLTGMLISDDHRTIGANVSYQLTAQLNEGTTSGLVVKNVLPSGMKLGAFTINQGNSGMVYTLRSSPAIDATGELVWDLGTVLNPSDTNDSNDLITIDFTAVIQNLPDNTAEQILTDLAHLEYLDGQNILRSTAEQSIACTVIEPQLAVTVSGPATISPGQPRTFTVNIPNAGESTAWQDSFQVVLPDEMRHQTPVLQSLKAGSRTLADLNPDDYDLAYDSTAGIWSIILKSANARLDPGETLTLVFQSALNNDQLFTVHSLSVVTNVIQYYSMDISSGVGPETRCYQPAGMTNHTELNIETPVITTSCTVDKAIAHPGDTLHYQVTLINNGNSDATGVTFRADLDGALASGTLMNVTSSSGSALGNPAGGVNGTGQISGSNISMAQGGGTVTLEWDVTLKPVLASGYVVGGQANLWVPNFPAPFAINLSEVTIQSSPVFTVTKTAVDINGGALAPGDIIRYAITVQNSGNEDARNGICQDAIPSNTTYVSGSTTLNGSPVLDPIGASPIETGLAIHTPGDGDGRLYVGKTAVIQFEVQINPTVTPGTIITNQAQLNAAGEGSGPIYPVFSDDPGTSYPDDGTLSVVGNSPALYAYKTVTTGNGGQPMPGDTLIYRTKLSSFGPTAATQVEYTDTIPQGTVLVDGSMMIDGIPSSLPVSGGSFTASLGTLEPGTAVDITYQVTVDSGMNGKIISCQGVVASHELPQVFSDADGNPVNGYQPTDIGVGSGPVIRATMLVLDINGGNVADDDTLEYRIEITNSGETAATHVVVVAPIPAQLSYLANSTLVNGMEYADLSGAAPILSPGINLGTVAAGEHVTIEYQVRVKHTVPSGTVIDCQAGFTTGEGVTGISDSPLDDTVEQGNDPQNSNDDDPTRVQVAGNLGSAKVSGEIWWDQDGNGTVDLGEPGEANWVVEIFQQNTLIDTAFTNANGDYQFTGMMPGTGYKIRFKNPSGKTVWQVIENITLLSGMILDHQDLPLHPTGIVYDAVTRQPVAGAMVRISGPAGFDPATLFPGEQDQVTDSQGFYKFNLYASGAPQGTYTISVTPPPGYSPVFPSTMILPESGVLTPADQGGVSPVTDQADVPRGLQETTYYLSFNLVTGGSDLINNHIPLDPILAGSVVLTKTAAKTSVTMGDFVSYTVKLENQVAAIIQPFTLEDRLPGGFKYAKGTARVNGAAVEPSGERTLSWNNLTLPAHGTMVVTYTLIVGSGTKEGNIYKNSAAAYHGIAGTAISNTGTAAVKVVGEPLFTASLVIGKVFRDINGNGIQDQGEAGIGGARIITTSGQIITTDGFGRYHMDAVGMINSERGQNVVLKVDPRSIPAGAVFTTENPRVVRLTQGVMAKVNFGVKLPPEQPLVQDSPVSQAAAAPPEIPEPEIQAPALPDAPAVAESEPPAPDVHVSTQKGFNNGSVLITMEGAEILPGIDVKLIGSGETTISGTIINNQTGKMEAFFDLKGQPEGTYNYYIFYPDGHSVKLGSDFEVRKFSPELFHPQTLVPVYFDLNKSNIRANQTANIAKDLVTLLKNPGAGIILGGYTDSRGSAVYNLGLSLRRATAVKQYLVEHGVKPEQIVIYAYGKELAKQGTSENVWQNDRRVDVIIYEDKQ